jgi:hypothetical protein
MPSLSLRQRVDDFLSSTRIGVDFGEHTGGIAVVRGNEILHAETFLDFHEATLEQRRALRRGRRGRHAKKMRLARLRSWVLRQKLPNGQRLPDPYSTMRDPAYMVQPGIYKQPGTEPLEAHSWVELAKQGQTDAAGFVRALTLIFQKRGYKWDAIALEEMSASRLKGFLLTARIPTNDPTLTQQVHDRIEQLKSGPDSPGRGKPKISPEELEACLQLACERGRQPPRPRVAEHRSVKEADLRAVVDGFAKSKRIHEDQAERWKKELCGLLNKALRPARFDNRLKTGCSWCGKAAPRKARFREWAYRAALNNLRVRENFRLRPLSDEERKPFLEWWADRAVTPGADSIAKRLSKMNPEQKGMARQLHDLLKNDKPTGRTSLCVEHLKMAAEGKTMKDAGLDWQNIAVRKAPNPCGERRDGRVLRRLEQILFRPGEHGEAAWRFGPVSFINMEIPEPETERPAKGTQAERKLESLKDRLAAESNGCIYKVIGDCGGEMDKDHIFPDSRGGPSRWENLVAACNAHNVEKGPRTPYEWLQNGGGNGHWNTFRQHIENLKLAERKRRILLNESNEYPEGDPTSLARVGARPRQFVVALRKLFRSYGVPLPRLDYTLNEPLVQRILGRVTHDLRFSWFVTPDGEENFPYPKNRSSLFNHAEDAAILAACPPHTWRPLIWCHTAPRLNRNGEMRPRPGLAIPKLAPDWAAYLRKRENPLIRILGRYPVTWKASFADLTFWRDPQSDAPRLKRYKLLKDITRKDFGNIVAPSMRSIVENIAASVGLGERGTIAEALARKLAGDNAKRSAVERELPRALEELEKRYPGLRRIQVSSQKGGTLARVVPSDGPMRKVQIKPASEGLIVWQAKRGTKLETKISLLRPRPLQKFGIPRIDPSVPVGASILGQLCRHDMIWLDGEPDRAEGFYRVTKCQPNGITVQPEEAVPAEIARRVGIRLDNKQSDRAAEAEAERINFSLGKQALVEYFTNKKKRNGRRTGSEAR